MQTVSIPYPDVHALSETDQAYLALDERLRDFYTHPPTLTQFEAAIQQRRFGSAQRQHLVEALRVQYEGLSVSAATQQNIEALADAKTFTITTAHQPSLMTGPLYFIYKIASTIQLTRRLQVAYPTYKFVPVFWLGGEDHDFEEVNHFRIFGKTLTWEDAQGGAVGQYNTESLAPVFEQLKEVFGDSEEAQALYERCRKAYLEAHNYATGTFHFVQSLFDAYGLVILQPNDAQLKASARPLFEREIFEQLSEPLVQAQIEKLEKQGFKKQAHPRSINLFLLGENTRTRLTPTENGFALADGSRTFTAEEMRQLIQENPSAFSPNVVLRPLYQEWILPNLAYIGGGGELAYWLERKTQFEAFDVDFPMLIRRNSVLCLDKVDQKKLQKLDLSVPDIFKEEEALIKSFVKQESDATLNLHAEIAAVEAQFEQAAQKAAAIHPPLANAVKAEATRQLKAWQQLESRLIREEKKKYDTAITQIRRLKEKLFPNQGLQERHDNMLSFYLRYGDAFIETLIDQLNPLDRRFLVLLLDDK